VIVIEAILIVFTVFAVLVGAYVAIKTIIED